MHDTEDKAHWVKEGEKLENPFTIYMNDPQLIINPEKATDDYACDLLYQGRPGDLKCVRTPFFTAGKKYGFDPSRTATFNVKDFERYEVRYPDIKIFMSVKWPAQENYGVTVDAIRGVWMYTLDEIFNDGDYKIHHYEKRKEDTEGNAKCSLLVQLKDENRVR